jgi:SAM-dependent methyltransferase
MVRVEELLGSITAWGRQPAHGPKRPAKPSSAQINVARFMKTDPSMYAGRSRPDHTLSSLCTFDQLDSPRFRHWAAALHEPWRAHRKLWELAYICEALDERGMLQPDRRGLGFAVGAEKLPALFAARGCRITATDLPAEDERNQAWAQTGQWVGNLASLSHPEICPERAFRDNVSYRPVDMNAIPDDLTGFDFTWSTCSFEHCGSIELGLRFLEEQMRCLAPGGIAVHTTEFNLSSNDSTVMDGGCVIFRLKDIEWVIAALRDAGHDVEPLDLFTGKRELDRYVDAAPYSQDRHLRLDLWGYASTSIGLIIRKSTQADAYGHLSADVSRRVRMTLSCRDTDPIPKVADAGEVIEQAGQRLQIMHEGSRVIADGYYGGWMTDVIRGLRGHHEPQEELLFHHLLSHVRQESQFVELGAYWAYYTNWYLGAVPGSTALCVEPDSASLEVGRQNLALNGRTATFIQAFVGSRSERSRVGRLECLDMDAVLARVDGRPIEVLHMDVQGAELPFIESMRQAVAERKVRFIVVSTHHESVFSSYQKLSTGATTTHEDCVRALQSLGAKVFVDHNVYESFSGDGLIVASFAAEDRSIVLPAISRNVRERSLFSGWISRAPVVTAAMAPPPPRQNGWLHRQVLKLRRSYRKRFKGGTARQVA